MANKIQATKEAAIEGVGDIFYSDAPFDQSLDSLSHVNASPISMSQLAYARTQVKPNHSLNKYGSHVKEGVLYVPNSDNRVILIRESPLLDSILAEKAVTAHRNRSEFLVNSEDIQRYIDLAFSKDNSVFVLSDRNNIPTNRFGSDERSLWLFQQNAQKYGEFLKDGGIDSIGLYFNSDKNIDNKHNPFLNQLWLHRLDDSSNVYGSYGYLFYLRLRGVCESGEASAPKIESHKVEFYTPVQLRDALKNLGISGLEKQILEELKRTK